MRLRGFLFACIASLSISGLAQDRTSQVDERLKDWLKRYPESDANKDGVLTRQEATEYRDNVLNRRVDNAGRRRQERPTPTRSDVRYGPHQRNVFDLWLPESASSSQKPWPVFVFFHGGGFVAGDKSSFDPTPYLHAGLAVVSGNYRFVDGKDTLSPAPLLDAARVIQFIRFKAGQWNLDASRIAVSGSSAGAVITMWIGYHDDLADPESQDPVSRLSTRVKCIVPLNGPTNLDPKWITANMGGPKHVHSSFPKMFGATVADSHRPEVWQRIQRSSPIEHVTSDDPPTLLVYAGSMEGIPLPESASQGQLIHHAYFGQVMKAKLDDLGVVNRFLPRTDPRKDGGKIVISWLAEHLTSNQ